MRITNVLISTVFLLVPLNIFSQQNNPLINASKIINAAYVLCDSGKYAAASDTLKYISKSDTAYVQALTELAYTYFLDKKYREAIQTSNLALTFPSNLKHRQLLLKGNAYDNMGNPDSSIIIYNEALKKYPCSYLLYYNLGISYMNNKQYDKAVEAFQQSIVRNPFHASSHLALGRIMGFMGQYTRAMLSLETYLIIEPNSGRSNNNLIFLNDLVNNNLSADALKIEPTVDNTVFNELDLLIKSGIANKSAYKSKIKFNAPVTKQTQLLFESLEYKPNTGDFWMEKYVPVFLAVKQNKFFENFSYTLLASTSDKNVATALNKNKKELKNMNGLLYDKLLEFCKNQIININGTSHKVDFYLDNNNYLVAVGNKASDNKTRLGYWHFFHTNCEPKAEGSYDNNGNLNGKWLNYEDDGSLSLEENYKDGKLHGEYIGYFNSGNKKYSANYSDGDINADVPYYFDCNNSISSVVHFEKGIRNGKVTSYYRNGNIYETYYYSNDSLTGENKCYYPNGSLKWIQNFRNDILHGKATYYYRNGKIESEVNYIMGEKDGIYNSYFNNGKLFQSGTFKKGLKTGVWNEYNKPGTLVEQSNYNDKGELNGETKGFDIDGKLHYTTQYVNGKEKEYSYFDKTGKKYATVKPGEKNAKAQGYYPDGLPLFTGAYNNNLIDGTWTFYAKSGKIESVKNYKNGILNGPYKSFYKQGVLSVECNYKDGELDGYYKKLFANGNINIEGWYVNGKQEGKWMYWNPDSSLKEEYHYLNNSLHGYNDEYSPDKVLQYSTKYQNNRAVSMISYDNIGKELSNINFDGTNDYTLYYFDKKIRAVADYKCNSMDKQFTNYYRDGKIRFVYNYLNDYKDGEYKSYYPDGTIKQEGYFESGSKNGYWTFYFDNGKVQSKGLYINNEQDSIWTGYYKNGKTRYISKFIEGTQIDTTYYYDSFGEFMYSLVYDKFGLVSYQYLTPEGTINKPIGPKDSGTIVTYYKNGKISAKQSISKSELFGKQTLYYSNGNVYKEFNLIDDEFDGVYNEYYDNGKIKQTENYIVGENHGTSKYYRPDGSLEHTEEYKNDREHGKFIYYNPQGKVTKEENYWNSIRID